MKEIGDVFGEYKIIEILKDGSKSPCAVYKGQHPTSKMVVIIKEPSKSLKDEVKTIVFNQLHEEVKILDQLRDVPYIVEKIAHGTQDGYPYLITRYVSNRSLNVLIENKTQELLLENIKKYIQQAARALQVAHEKNIINCDIKPEHILLKDDDEEIAICDFGLAVWLSPGAEQKPRKTQLNGMTRRKGYMAPEQKGNEGKEGYHCRESDQFALGLVAYELLYRKLPDGIPQITKNRGEQGEFLTWQIPAVLERALAPNPENRFKSIQAFADALTKAIEYESKEVAKKSSAPTPAAQLNESNASPPPSKPISAISPPKQNSDDDQASRSRSVAFSRRTFFKLVPLTVIDAVTLGVLGASWVELEPKITQLFAPQIVNSISPKQFGIIYNLYHGHQANVNGLAWAPDNKRIASASYDGTVQVWYADNGVRFTNFTGNTGATIPMYDVAWSPTENKVASCSIDLSRET